jgi:LssY C-terminus
MPPIPASVGAHPGAPAARRWHGPPEGGPSTIVPARLLALAAALLLASCSTYRPRPPADPPFRARAQTDTHGAVKVSVAALGAKESKQYFGVDLASKGIQPVWLQIDNNGDAPLYLLLSSIDPAYFSAREAAYQMHSLFGRAGNERMDEFFESQAIDGRVPAESARSGFVFTNLDEGVKYVTVQLFGPNESPLLYFLLDVPGIRTDYAQVDLDALYAEDELLDLDSEAQLRAALERLPAYTTRPDGSGRGDGLNFVVIGTPDEVGGTLVATGWQVTEALSAGSGWRTFKSFLFGGSYRYSPMSSLYVFGRSQDAGFQKARDSIHQRNHLRVWLTPLRYKGRDVWIGAISRDIGVYFTTRAWSLTTHAIDPDLDEAREALAEDLVLSQAVSTFGYVSGVSAAPREVPHRNLMRAPYWTDGLRAVFMLGDEVSALNDITLLEWEQRGGGVALSEWIGRRHKTEEDAASSPPAGRGDPP